MFTFVNKLIYETIIYQLKMNRTKLSIIGAALVIGSITIACTTAHQDKNNTLANGQTIKNISQWQFSRDSSAWLNITIPHSTNAIDGHSQQYYRGTTYYNTTINIEQKDVNRPTYLIIEGAAQQSTIYLNNQQLTHHNGGYTAFSVNLTGKLLAGSNTIAITCDNHEDVELIPVSSDFNKNNGLHNEVKLLQLNNTHFDPTTKGPYRINAYSQHIEGQGEKLTILTDIASLHPSQNTLVSFYLRDAQGNIVRQQDITTIANGQANCEIMVENAHLWNGVTDPYLYTIEAHIISNGNIEDITQTKFGFRYFELTPDNGFYLNGKPYPLHGVAVHQDIEDKASAMSLSDYDNDYKIIKEMGANMVRLAHYPHNDRAFQICDSLGFVVQTEIPWVNVCGENATEKYFQTIHMQASEMTHNLINHPCICFWGLWNELDTWGNKPELQGTLDCQRVVTETAAAYDVIRAIDPSRPIGITDCCVLRNEGYPALKADFISENRYNGWYYEVFQFDKFTTDMQHIKNISTKHTVNVSEYGAGINPYCHTADVEAIEDIRRDDSKHFEEYGNLIHESHWQQICQMPYLNFTTLWVMFDFPVANRQEGYMDSDDGINFTANEYRKYTNDKGVVTRNRQLKKDIFYLYKAAWNHNETTVKIANTRLTKWLIDKPITIKVYSNAKQLSLYQNGELKQTLDNSGEVSGVIWQFQPLHMLTDNDTFKVIADSGESDEWTLTK